MAFGDILKSWRKGEQLYQKEASEKLSVELRRYAAWERSERTPDMIIQAEIIRRMGLQND